MDVVTLLHSLKRPTNYISGEFHKYDKASQTGFGIRGCFIVCSKHNVMLNSVEAKFFKIKPPPNNKTPQIIPIFEFGWGLYCAKRHFRSCVTEIDRVFFLVCVSGEDGRDN